MLLSLYYIHDNQYILLVTSSAADLEKKINKKIKLITHKK
jgi:hypothetical protein